MFCSFAYAKYITESHGCHGSDFLIFNFYSVQHWFFTNGNGVNKLCTWFIGIKQDNKVKVLLPCIVVYACPSHDSATVCPVRGELTFWWCNRMASSHYETSIVLLETQPPSSWWEGGLYLLVSHHTWSCLMSKSLFVRELFRTNETR